MRYTLRLSVCHVAPLYSSRKSFHTTPTREAIMPAFDPEKYAPVEQRVTEFYTDYPEASIRTFVASADEKSIMFEARCFRTLGEARDGIYTSGFAHEVMGSGPVNKTNHVENAETSAVGRALANLGYSGKIGGKSAPRPSREEMEQAQARRANDETHARMVAFLREVGARCDEDVLMAIGEAKVPIKGWVRDNWKALKTNQELASRAVVAVEESTGETFDGPT